MGPNRIDENTFEDTEIPSYKDLLTMKRYDKGRFKATQAYKLYAKVMGQIAFETKFVMWTRNGLNDGILLLERQVSLDLLRKCSFRLRKFALVPIRVTVAPARPKPVHIIPIAVIAPEKRDPLKSKWIKSEGQTVGNKVWNRDEAKYARQTYTLSWLGGGQTPQYSSILVRRKVASSVRTPNFKAASKSGQLPQNPYSLEINEYSSSGFTHNTRYFDGRGTMIDDVRQEWAFCPFLSINDAIVQHLAIDENRLTNKLAARISGPTANIGEDVATWRLTMRLFTSKAGLIAESARALRNFDLDKWGRILQRPVKRSLRKAFTSFVGGTARASASGAKKSTVILSHLWLEYRYGWLPLLGDIAALVDAWHRISSKQSVLGRAVATAVRKDEYDVPVYGLANFKPLAQCGNTHYALTTVHKVCLTYTLDSVVVNTLSSLGLTAPVGLAWELIPFSFVVDWFLPIGQALQTFSNFEGLSFKDGYRIDFTRKAVLQYLSAQFSVPYTPGENGGPGGEETVTGGGSCTGMLYTRTPLLGWPTGSLPQFKNPISALHAANAAALVVSVLSGGRG